MTAAASLARYDEILGELAARRVRVKAEIRNLERELTAIDRRLAEVMAEQGRAIGESGCALCHGATG